MTEKETWFLILEDNGKIVGYLTGLSIYNQLGFSTQVSNSIQIGKNEVRPQFVRGRYFISFVKQKNTINKENIYALQLLDVLRFINKIPDVTIENTLKRFIDLLKHLIKKLNLIQFFLVISIIFFISYKYQTCSKSDNLK